MSAGPCADCIKGSLDEGSPKGTDTTIAGVPCYISKAAQQSNGGCIILATDIFGYKLINARLIADAYADAGFTCVVPDYFEGEPMDMQLLEAFEALPTKSFFGKVATGLQLVVQVVKLVRCLVRHGACHNALPPSRCCHPHLCSVCQLTHYSSVGKESNLQTEFSSACLLACAVDVVCSFPPPFPPRGCGLNATPTPTLWAW